MPPAADEEAVHLEPGYNPDTGVLQELPEALKDSSTPQTYEKDRNLFPNFPPTFEKNSALVLDKLLPIREGKDKSGSGGVSIDSSTPSSTASVGSGFGTSKVGIQVAENEESIFAGVPEDIKASAIQSFEELVKNGDLQAYPVVIFYNGRVIVLQY
jgi:hypothetical protein